MKIFYRGYLIHQPIPGFDSTVYGRLPGRVELTDCPSNRKAMEWVDRHLETGDILLASLRPQLALNLK